MKARHLTWLLVGAVCVLALVGSALASPADSYRLDWFTPLTGGGGAASSANYAIHYTIGQTAAGTSSSTSYGACLGYWCGAMAGQHRIHLPLVLRNYS